MTPVRALLAASALGLPLLTVATHDAYCHYVHFDRAPLCQRADGTLWRDPSGGCSGHEDPSCGEAVCADSEMLSEASRHTCSWLISQREQR